MRKLLFIMIFLSAGRVFSQSNFVNQYPSVYYQRGLELFDEKKYNAAIVQFNLFLENSTSEGTRSEAEYYLAVSKLFAEHSDGEAAVKRFLEKNPGSHKTHMANLTMGDYYYLKRKYSTALPYYQRIDPMAIARSDRDRYVFRMGYCQVMRKKYKDAAETLKPLTERENDYKVLATYYYAYCAYYTGDFAGALRGFKQIEDSGPKMIRLYIAQIYYQQGEYEKAISYLDKFGQGLPRNQTELLKGKCYYRINKFDKAAESFTKSGFTKDSLDKNEIYEFGFANYKTEKYAKAVDWFKVIATRGDSISQFASYNMGHSLLELGNKRDAMNAFAEAYRTGLNKMVAEDALFNQAKLAVDLNENNAASVLQRYVDNYPKSANSAEAKKLLAKLMLNTDNYKDAVTVLESIGELDAQTEESYQRVTLARGMELFKSRDWSAAMQMFDKCIAKRANRSLIGQASYWKAEALVQQGSYGTAEPLYQKFVDAPGVESLDYYPYAYYGLGYSKYKAESYKEASVYFAKYVQLSTRGKYNEKVYNDAQLRLGDCYLMTKNLNEATNAYAYVTGKKASDADYALFQTGIIYGLQKQREKKISVMKRLSADYPNSRFIADAYFEIGVEYLALKNNREAEKYFMYVIDDFKGNALVGKSYAVLGRMYYNAGQDDKAIDMYTKLYDQYPGTAEARAAADAVKRIYTENGRAPEYIKWASKRTNISNAEKDSVLYDAAYTLYAKTDYKNAVRAFGEYLDEMRNGMFVINAHYYKAICHEILKDKTNAIAEFKYVADAEGNENQEDAVLSLLRLYGPNGTCEELITYVEKIEKLTKVKETRHQAWRHMLRCYDKMGKVNEGREVARRIGDELSTPDDMKAEALVYTGKTYFRENKYRNALDKYAEAYSKYNNIYAAEAKYREAELLYSIDSVEACINACYDVMDQFEGYDFWLGKAMLLLGDAYLKKGDDYNAKATWNSVKESFEKIPEIYNEAREKLAKLSTKGIGN